jgi:glutamyl endopeptidase
MARAATSRAPTGKDKRVSNHPEERAVVRARTIQRPSEGVDPRTPEPNADGTEAVRRRRRESAAERAWRPPESAELRDIGEASFGPPPPARETVHGPDDRIRITNTSIYPWRVHASLLITAADNSAWIGTGWFISPRTLITAGHVVYIKNSGVPGRDGWVKSINVMPGRNANNLPYGTATSRIFHSVTGWTEDGDEHYDYGAIIIPTPLGETVGVFGFGVFSDSDLRDSVGNIAGYPGDKPSGTLWYDNQRIASVTSRKVFYDIDTMGGQSGSAVYRFVGSDRIAIAVHAYGGARSNSGTRISRPVYDNMRAWKA